MSEIPNSDHPDFDDIFREMTDELEPQLGDPYLKEIHSEALSRQEIVATSMLTDTEIDPLSVRQAHVQQLDAKWRYMNMPVTVSGRGWAAVPGLTEMQASTYVDQAAISRGFLFFTDSTEQSDDHFPKISHLVEIDAGKGDGTRMPIVLPLEELAGIELPFPSPELRERRFAYYYPEDANTIDELAFTSRRDDQVIKDFGEFVFEANLSDEEQLEHVRDAAQYLRSRAEIDPHVNYHISVAGECISVKDNGDGIPVVLRYPYTRTMRVKSIELRSSDIRSQELNGMHRCVPFIEATAYEPNGSERELIIPCTSILWMSSARYDTATPPQF